MDSRLAAHDRFLIVDETDVYHIGASLKDFGKKMFAFSKLDIPAAVITDLFFTTFAQSKVE